MASPLINLTVKSTSGTFEGRFNPANRAQKILDEAIRYFSLSGSGYILKKGSTVLALGEKIGDLGIVDGDVLVLQARQPQDG